MNWPGVYRLRVAARLLVQCNRLAIPVARIFNACFGRSCWHHAMGV